MKNRSFFLLLVALLMVAGCRKKTEKINIDPMESGADKKLFDMAVNRIKKDPEKARLLFNQVMQIYPDSVYAVRSKLGLADSYFHEKDSASLIQAAAEYQEFVSLFPYSPDAIYAKFQVGMCYYQQARKPGRDQDNTFKAISGFEQMIQQYPDTPEAQQAKLYITKCRQTLGEHYFTIGYYNLVLGAVQGSLVRFKQVLDEYPDFAKNDQLFFYTGKAYMLSGEFDTAISFFQRVQGSFPKSKFAAKAPKMLKEVERYRAKWEVLKKKIQKQQEAKQPVDKVG